MLARTTTSRPHGKRFSFRPDYLVKNVVEIDFDRLVAQGVKAVFIDLDGTVVPHGSFDVTQAIKGHLQGQKLQLFIATNRRKNDQLKDIMSAIGARGIVHPRGLHIKPSPRYFALAAREHKLKRSEIVMIGDRYVQDIFGANLAGMTTVAVRKLDLPSNPIDRLVSKIEERFTDWLAKRYHGPKP